ncbi:MAG: hypothetical protein ACYTKD_12375 [Planctomycetota bacterium]
MARRKRKDIDRLMMSRRVIERAAAEGVAEALRRHVQAGVPAAEWADGRLVWVTPRRLAARLRIVDGAKA